MTFMSLFRGLTYASITSVALLVVALAGCGGDATSDSGPATGGPGAVFPVTVVKTEMANRCGTSYGGCYVPAMAKGLSCYCMTPYGAIPGTAF